VGAVENTPKNDWLSFFHVLALMTCTLSLDVNDLSAVATVVLRGTDLFASCEMAGMHSSPSQGI
jgi:hypothetical protein